MFLPERNLASGPRGGTGVLACLACVWLSFMGAACSAFIDEELSSKGEGSGSGGSGGSEGSGAGGQVATLTTTGTTMSGSGGECTGPSDCHLAHASAKCEKGGCEVDKCTWSFADCDHEDADGCEVDLEQDDQHCGECGKECDDGEECAGGKCT